RCGVRCLEFLAPRERRERPKVGVAERRYVDGAFDVVEPPRKSALERDGHAEERMGDARVAPVEEQVAAVTYEDLPVVEVVVLDRLGYRERAELSPHLRDLLTAGPQPIALNGRQVVHLLYQLFVLSFE